MEEQTEEATVGVADADLTVTPVAEDGPTEPAASAETTPAVEASPETSSDSPNDPNVPNDAPAEGFGEILAAFEETDGAKRKADPAIGDKVKGRVLSIGDESTFLDLGTKSEAMIPTADLRDKEGNIKVAVGDEVTAMVAGRDEESNCLVLKKKSGGGGRGAEAAAEIQRAFEAGLAVEGRITGMNKGGLEVDVNGVRAFCPVSQIENRFVEDASGYVGQRHVFRIIRYETPGGGKRPNIVLSRRALLQEEADAKATEARANLSVGAIVTGRVTSLTTYGAFIDLGGVEGLLHVSEIGHSRLARPEDALKVDQEVEVQILKIEQGKDDKRTERISLSRKALERDPWRDAASRYAEGTVVTGKVVRLETFGAFVELSPGLDGLVHISELAQGKRLQHSKEAVKIGQELQVKVLGVETSRRRISLGVAGEGEHDDVDDAAAPPRVAAPQGTFGSLGDFFKNRR